MNGARRRTPAAAVALGAGATIVSVLPGFLTGAMAVQMTRDLGFGAAALGAAVAMQRASGVAFSPFLGRAADRLGGSRSIQLAATLAALASFGIATTATRWIILMLWLAVSGSAQALAQPAANRLLTSVVRPNRLGTAFGLKQSAPPTATMLAGLSVPLIALTLGWRWAFVAAGSIAVIVAFFARRPNTRSHATTRARGPRGRLHHRRVIALLAVAFGLANAASSSVTAFYVDAAVQAGSPQRFAGTMLAVASLAAVATRVILGAVSDRMDGGHLRMCSAVLLTGSLGVPLLATNRPGLMAVGVVITVAGTWGFNGVFWYTLVRTWSERPGHVTGVLAPGGHMGGISGPVLFGLIAESAGYPPAWALVGTVTILGAGAMLLGSKRLPVNSTDEPVGPGVHEDAVVSAAKGPAMPSRTQGPDQPAPGDQGPPYLGEHLCPDCSGSGRVNDDTCRTCGGSGKVVEPIGGE